MQRSATRRAATRSTRARPGCGRPRWPAPISPTCPASLLPVWAWSAGQSGSPPGGSGPRNAASVWTPRSTAWSSTGTPPSSRPRPSRCPTRCGCVPSPPGRPSSAAPAGPWPAPNCRTSNGSPPARSAPARAPCCRTGRPRSSRRSTALSTCGRTGPPCAAGSPPPTSAPTPTSVSTPTKMTCPSAGYVSSPITRLRTSACGPDPAPPTGPAASPGSADSMTDCPSNTSGVTGAAPATT